MYRGCGLYGSDEFGGWNPVGVMNYDNFNYTRKPRRFGKTMGVTYDITLEELAASDPNFPKYSISPKTGKVIKTQEVIDYLVERIEDAWALQKQPKPSGVDSKEYAKVKTNYNKIATALLKHLPKNVRAVMKNTRKELKYYNKLSNNNQERWDKFVKNPDRSVDAWKYLYNLENVDLNKYPQYEPAKREVSQGFSNYLNFVRQFRAANRDKYPKGVIPRAVISDAWNSVKGAQGVFRQSRTSRINPRAAAGPASMDLN